MLPHERHLILASQSPRRKQLLALAGFTFDVRPLDIDESWPEDLPVKEVAPYLARKKAQAGKHLLEKPGNILLTADSVVILDGKIYNKPADAAEAKAMLSLLSGRKHRVITGACLLSLEKEKVFSGISDVHLESLSEAEIDYYIRTHQPFDKAGAYAIQEWIGLCKISKIEGTYPNIMGLPLDLVYRHLEDW